MTDVLEIENNASTVATASIPPVIFPHISATSRAIQDFMDGLRQWPLWLMLAYQDIKLRYRRSVLGPFWITLSMAITVYSMGFLYGRLFHIDLPHYYPFLVAGMLGWTLIQSIIIEVNDTFTTLESTIKQIKLPYSLYIHRIIMRNIIIFFHNMLVIVPVMILYHDTIKLTMNTLLLIPGLFIIYINGIFYGLILAILGARYRDISQMVKSLIQVVFFLTPVMWNPSNLSARIQAFIYWNPFYSYLALIREPLLGNAPDWLEVIIVIAMTFVGMAMCACLFTRYRSRIIYWL